jgi:hypothetical protein
MTQMGQNLSIFQGKCCFFLRFFFFLLPPRSSAHWTRVIYQQRTFLFLFLKKNLKLIAVVTLRGRPSTSAKRIDSRNRSMDMGPKLQGREPLIRVEFGSVLFRRVQFDSLPIVCEWPGRPFTINSEPTVLWNVTPSDSSLIARHIYVNCSCWISRNKRRPVGNPQSNLIVVLLLSFGQNRSLDTSWERELALRKSSWYDVI